MHHLGQTRSAIRSDHLLQTPDTFVRAPLPGMVAATAVVHVGPARWAQRFPQYTAELRKAGGALGPAHGRKRFLYVLEGEVEVGGVRLGLDHYTFAPQHYRRSMDVATRRARGNRDRKELSTAGRLYRAASHAFSGDEGAVAPQPLTWTTPPSKCAACFRTTQVSISR